MVKDILCGISATYLELEDVEILDDVDALLEVDTLEDVDTLTFNSQKHGLAKPFVKKFIVTKIHGKRVITWKFRYLP